MKVLHTHLTIITISLVSLLMTPTILYAQTPLLEMFNVQSNSMAPVLHYHDKVLVDTIFPYNLLRVGDIIAFKTFGTNSTGQHETIIHRIVQEVIYKYDMIIRTKGDATNASIPSLDYPVFQQNYIGKAVYRITAGNVIGDNKTIR